MLNKYEQQRLQKEAGHKDMETRVDPAARDRFKRRPYPTMETREVKGMLEIKRELNFLFSRAGMLDSWEQETIRRIAKRVKEGSDQNGQAKTGEA